MTALHELGHAFDFTALKGGRITQTKAFKEALAKDQQNLKNVKLSAPQRSFLTYQHYAPKNRPLEVFAEGFATVHGLGRPTPAKGWPNSKRFRKAYPNVIKLIEGLK